MDIAVLGDVCVAIRIVHAPSSSDSERKTAQEYCDKVLQCENAPEYGIRLADKRSGYDDIIRHFGFHILEHAIKFRWNQYPADTRTQYKCAILELLDKGTDDMLAEQVFIKEKVCRIIVEMAKRDWPQRWLDFLDILLGMMVSNNPKRIEYALMIIRTMGEDVFIYADRNMEDQRRLDIVAALTASFPTLIPTLYGTLASSIASINTTAFTNIEEKLAVRALDALTVLVDRFPISYCASTGLLPTLANLVSSKTRLAVPACECLLVLVSRKTKLEERDQFLYLFGQLQLFYNVFTQAPPSSSSSSSPSLSLDEYPLQKRTAQMLVQLGIYQLPLAKTIETAYFAQYLDLMLTIAHHPSLLISSFTLPLWLFLLRQPVFLKDPEYERIFPLFLDLCKMKMLKHGDPERKESSLLSPGEEQLTKDYCDQISIIKTYTRIDFNTSDEFWQFYAAYRNQLGDLFRLVSEQQPERVSAYVFDELQLVIVHRVAPFYLMLDARLMLLDASFQAKHESEAVHECYKKILELLLNDSILVPDHPMIQSRILSSCETLFPVLSWYPDMTGIVLEKYLRAIKYKAAEDRNYSTAGELQVLGSENTFAVRRHACLSLVRLAIGEPQVLPPYFGMLLDWIQKSFQGNDLLDNEKTLLLEFLTAASATLPIQNRLSFIGSIMDPLIAEWGSVECQMKLQSPESLIDLMGINYLSNLAIGKPQNKWQNIKLSNDEKSTMRLKIEQTRKVFYLLNTIYLVIKRVNETNDIKNIIEDIHSESILTIHHPMANYFKSVLPNLLVLLRSWHLLCDPTQSNHSSFLNVVLARTARDERTKEMPNETHLQGQIALLRTIVPLIPENAYNLLAQGTLLGVDFYGINDIQMSLNQAIFQHVSTMELGNIKTLITTFVKPLLMNCPMFYLGGLTIVLPNFFNYLFKKLNTDWIAISDTILQSPATLTETGGRGEQGMGHNDNDGYGDDDDEVDEEINVGRTLRDFTRSFFDVMYQLFNPIHEASLENTKQKADFGKMKVLVEFLMNEPLIGEPLLMIFGHALCWRDSVSCRRSIAISLRLLPMLTEKVVYHPIIGKDWMACALRGLHDAYHQEAQQDLISIITAIYARLRPLADFPRQIFLSIPNMNEAKINEFEHAFFQEKMAKKLRSLMRIFLKEILGVNLSEWYAARESFILDLPEKLFIKRNERRPITPLLSESETSDLTYIGDLFGSVS